MSEKDYSAQKKHIRTHYVRFPLDLRPEVTAEYIKRVEAWINNYPREILGFETSGSLFEKYFAKAA